MEGRKYRRLDTFYPSLSSGNDLLKAQLGVGDLLQGGLRSTRHSKKRVEALKNLLACQNQTTKKFIEKIDRLYPFTDTVSDSSKGDCRQCRTCCPRDPVASFAGPPDVNQETCNWEGKTEARETEQSVFMKKMTICLYFQE
ncbi:uncharacterized protein LOC110101677 [Dendrobium catenatum]|uniref:uncharacterized protein LOC110101677 n=1 Tax=Dendrobium catenatum TaxID=906689 RepID=UPI0010A001B8|nr:uncharacterized protein LOC110101677 [Dendrobium catenatum]